MKKLSVLLLLLVSLISCEKEDVDQDFKSMAVLDLRANNNFAPLALVDFVGEVIAVPGTNPILYDTLGRTEVRFNGDLIFDYPWQHGYMSSISLRTRVVFSSSENIYVVFIANSDIFFNEIAIINSTGTLLKKADFSTVSIKKVEIDEVSRKLRITINNSWSRTGESSDDVKIINY
jgi:hypothetical protein